MISIADFLCSEFLRPVSENSVDLLVFLRSFGALERVHFVSRQIRRAVL